MSEAMSQSIGNLAKALAAAQGEMTFASKDKVNPAFRSKYADLAACWEAVRGPLSRHGLAVVQSPTATGGAVTVTTTLLHESGEWMSSSLTLAAKDGTPHPVGGAITYARRFGLCAVCGVAQDDDDGNGAMPDHGNGRSEAVEKARAEQAAREAKAAAEEAKVVEGIIADMAAARDLTSLECLVPSISLLSEAGKKRLGPIYKSKLVRLREIAAHDAAQLAASMEAPRE